jgi:hypothetical protein
MRKTILTIVAILAIGGAATGILIANAQPAPPPDQDGAPHRHGMGWMRHGPGGEWRGHEEGRGGPMGRRTFALIYPQSDRQLTPPDVQKIAEAFLLWNGNHTWKVTNVAPTADGAIGFALATQENSVVARFTIDPHTGRVTRTG